ncbi:hypothetical protein H4S08_002312 [Coemansia sp. RSA 1365]|nr:hypothetical protein H4S08_002312 [Coemansia sp. RSA 1365]
MAAASLGSPTGRRVQKFKEAAVPRMMASGLAKLVFIDRGRTLFFGDASIQRKYAGSEHAGIDTYILSSSLHFRRNIP